MRDWGFCDRWPIYFLNITNYKFKIKSYKSIITVHIIRVQTSWKCIIRVQTSFTLTNATIAGSKCLLVPLTEACKFWGRLIIHAQGEQIPHLYGPLHAKWRDINCQLSKEVVAHGVHHCEVAVDPEKKSIPKLSQVLDADTYNMQLCIYPSKE